MLSFSSFEVSYNWSQIRTNNKKPEFTFSAKFHGSARSSLHTVRVYEMCLTSNGTGSINVLFYLTILQHVAFKVISLGSNVLFQFPLVMLPRTPGKIPLGSLGDLSSQLF